MEPHLAEEEQTVVPILRAFFDQKEVAAKGERECVMYANTK